MNTRLFVSHFNNKSQVAFPFFLFIGSRDAIGNEWLIALCASYLIACILSILECFYRHSDTWTRTLRISLLCAFSTFMVCSGEIIYLKTIHEFNGLFGYYGIVFTLLALSIVLIFLCAVSVWGDFTGRKDQGIKQPMA
jgi:hypothetical protein